MKLEEILPNLRKGKEYTCSRLCEGEMLTMSQSDPYIICYGDSDNDGDGYTRGVKPQELSDFFFCEDFELHEEGHSFDWALEQKEKGIPVKHKDWGESRTLKKSDSDLVAITIGEAKDKKGWILA